jgi:hypothetical protein
MYYHRLTRAQRIDYYLRYKRGEHLKDLCAELKCANSDMTIIVEQGMLDYEGEKYELANLLMNQVL